MVDNITCLLYDVSCNGYISYMEKFPNLQFFTFSQLPWYDLTFTNDFVQCIAPYLILEEGLILGEASTKRKNMYIADTFYPCMHACSCLWSDALLEPVHGIYAQVCGQTSYLMSADMRFLMGYKKPHFT